MSLHVSCVHVITDGTKLAGYTIHVCIHVCMTIDHLDYVNGIGNHSHEPYICMERWLCTLCYVEVDVSIEFYVASIEVAMSKRQ